MRCATDLPACFALLEKQVELLRKQIYNALGKNTGSAPDIGKAIQLGGAQRGLTNREVQK